MRILRLIWIVIFASNAFVFAVDHHVSPTGLPTGDGSSSKPWDLQTALDSAPGSDRKPKVSPGDTVWLHGGTYRGGFRSRLEGTDETPITVRQAVGERAIIECALIDGRGEPEFIVEGGHTVYWGFEVTCSDPKRETIIAGSWPADIRRGSVICRGSNVKFINLVIHDLGNGIGFWSEAEGGEVYGCLIFNNGWKGPERGHGHGIYAQNKLGKKRFIDNIIFNQFGYGIHCYGTASAFLSGFHIEGNAGFNNGVPFKITDHNPAIFVGGGTSVKDLTIAKNFIYGGSLRCGYSSDVGNADVTVQDNVIAGGMTIQNFDTVKATGNKIISSDTLALVEFPSELNSARYDWDRNSYFRTGGRFPPFHWRLRSKNFSGEFTDWQAATQFDSQSSFHATLPTIPQVSVRPNQYESGRANIFVFNPNQDDFVEIDLSQVLKLGQRFSIVSVQNINAPAVVTAKYQGRAIRLSMKSSGTTNPVGMPDFVAPMTEPEFGVYLLRPDEQTLP